MKTFNVIIEQDNEGFYVTPKNIPKTKKISANPWQITPQ